MKKFPLNFTKLAFLLIAINILLSSYWLINGDIHYDVDVSRDFLVINDIVQNHHFTLLGPRSGAIQGVFHGPLWFYINAPIFFISNGNPVAVGWFWFLLSIIFTILVFWVSKKIFNTKVALLSILLLSVNSIMNPTYGLKNFYNPYGAVFLTPLFFFWFISYIRNLKIKYLLLSLFTLGLIIQFQMAFGIPILLSTTFYLMYYLFIRKKIWHFVSYLILIIPLSTFILFDLKHNWLQLNAVIQYITVHQDKLNIIDLLLSRLNAFVFNFFDMLSPGKNIFTGIFTILFIVGSIISFRKSQAFERGVYQIFFYLLSSFWIISLGYSGEIGNYFWPFIPLTIIIFCSFSKYMNKKIFFTGFLVLYIINFYTGIAAIRSFDLNINKRGPHSWAFNLEVAKNIYQDASQDFGFYNYSPDRLGYQQRYAMIYAQKLYPQIHSFPSTKKSLTYLIEVAPAKDRPELNSFAWRISDIKIDRNPNQTFRWDFIQVEKYYLNTEEIKVPTNPDLLDPLTFR
ncbi:MAG: hypothetical protein PHQ59_02415 [Candidatus Daviesbacteria bacterium]|nr:hypothetical protein [Candidatus Daviesbacteria bacterium]